MLVAKVIGKIWSTRKEESLCGLKFLIVCPLNLLDEQKPGTPIVAVDSIGAGIGETVLIVSGSSARNALGRPDVPVDATVVGIVDDKELNTSVLSSESGR